jgi:hypothetical protein
VIYDRRVFQCVGYKIEPAGPGGALIFISPIASLGAVYIPNLAAGLRGLLDALDQALRSPARLGSFGGDMTFSVTDDDKQLRIVSGTYTIFLDRHLADALVRDLELMQ